MCNHSDAGYNNLWMYVWGMRLWNMEHLSGCVESYLESLYSDSIEEIPSEPEVTPGFEKSECEVLGRSHTCGKSSPKEAASLDELKKSADDLQEKVEDLAGCLIVTVDMLQFKSPVLLDIEALVFNLPYHSSSIIGDFDHIPLRDLEIGDPLESGGLHLPCLIRLGLKALENGDGESMDVPTLIATQPEWGTGLERAWSLLEYRPEINRAAEHHEHGI